MKFRTIVFLVIITIILIGVFTKPGPEAFKEFYAREGGIRTPPVIEYADRVAYTTFSVTSFGITNTGTKELAVPVVKEKFLGLFGRFWKL